MSLETLPIDVLWRSALAVVPMAVLVAVVCRLAPCRPSTRHSLWLVVMVLLVASPFLPPIAGTSRLLQALPPAGDTPPTVSPPAAPAAHTGRAPAALPPPAPAESFVFGLPAVLSNRTAAHPTQPQSWGAFGRPSTEPSGSGGGLSSAQRSGNAPAAPGIGAATLARAGVVRHPLIRWGALEPSPLDRVRAEPRQDDRAPIARAKPLPRADRARAAAIPAAAPDDAWRLWVAQLAAIREAVMRLPSIPAGVWAAGIGLLALVTAVRVSRGRALLAGGTAAPPSVETMVRSASRRLHLRQPPATLMVDARISPMLWCGRPTRLILPKRLWAQLDDVGRRAVIYHELAHLRRRDHWVCRAELIIGWIYWWHPVVWWIRRRLREEADLCCDAWVTTLLPAGRRAYAQALLEARKYDSLNPHAVPAVGLGVMTVRARRFARRLTMVMTDQTRPDLSRKGVVLACALALGGLLVTPLWACPPEPKDDCASSKDTKAPKADRKMKLIVPAAPEPPRPPKAPRPPRPPRAPEPPETTFEQFMQGYGGDEMSIEQRIEQLEQQIELLKERLRNVREGLPGPGSGSGSGIGRRGPVVGARPHSMLGNAVGVYSIGMGPSASSTGACLHGGGPCSGTVVTRAYRLPEGKLKALTELMIRDDVPVRVRASDESIEVQATEAQHCAFDAFVMMLSDDDQPETYQLPEGKLEALSELMVRSDVPILVEPGETGIKVHGSELEQAVFASFVRLLGDGEAVGTGAGPSSAAYATALTEMAQRYESQADAQVYELEGLRTALRSLRDQARRMEREADRAHDRAHRQDDKAAGARDEANELRERAESAEGRDRQKLLAKAEALMAKAQALEAESQALHETAESLAEQAEAMEDQADALEEQIEQAEEGDDHAGWGGDDDDDEDGDYDDDD